MTTIEGRAKAAGITQCPFCKSKSLTVQGPTGLGIKFVLCYTCGSMGPEANTEEEAILKWNTRPGL